MHLLVIIAAALGVGAIAAQVSNRIRAQPAPIPVRVTPPAMRRD